RGDRERQRVAGGNDLARPRDPRAGGVADQNAEVRRALAPFARRRRPQADDEQHRRRGGEDGQRRTEHSAARRPERRRAERAPGGASQRAQPAGWPSASAWSLILSSPAMSSSRRRSERQPSSRVRVNIVLPPDEMLEPRQQVTHVPPRAAEQTRDLLVRHLV